jgi:hypothetical protein
LGDGTIDGEEPLRVSSGLEALHAPFPLARRLVGVSSPISQIALLPMFRARQYLIFSILGYPDRTEAILRLQRGEGEPRADQLAPTTDQRL